MERHTHTLLEQADGEEPGQALSPATGRREATSI